MSHDHTKMPFEDPPKQESTQTASTGESWLRTASQEILAPDYKAKVQDSKNADVIRLPNGIVVDNNDKNRAKLEEFEESLTSG